MFSVQPTLFHLVKLENTDNLVNLSSDSSKGVIPNVPLPSSIAQNLVSNSKCNEHLKSIFTPIGLSGQSNIFYPPFHPNT